FRVAAPLRHVAGHVVRAPGADSERHAVDWHRPFAEEIRAFGCVDAFTDHSPRKSHSKRQLRRIERGLFPLIDCRQLLPFPFCKRRSLVPRHVSHRMVLASRGRRSAGPAPWTGETGRVVEAGHRLIEADLFSAVHASMLPHLFSPVAPRADELFEVAVRYFITINEEVAQIDHPVARSGPAGQAVLP